MKKITVLFVFFQICFFNSFGQEDNPQNDNSYYFDDGRSADASNILKANILSTLSGDVSISYEKILGHAFSVELRAGIIGPHYIPDFFPLDNTWIMKMSLSLKEDIV